MLVGALMKINQRLSKTIESISYQHELPFARRLNVFPYVLLYVAAAVALLVEAEYTLYIVVALTILAFSHILSFLFTHWSVDFNTLVAYKKVCYCEHVLHLCAYGYCDLVLYSSSVYVHACVIAYVFDCMCMC